MEEQTLASAVTPELGEAYDAVVIGAGIGGLVCAALLAKEGMRVLAVERHDRPGGFATDFERKGYLFQIPLVMSGCNMGGTVTRVLEHLGARADFTRVEPWMRFIYPEHDIPVSSDVDSLKEALKDAFQPQTENINRFFAMAERAGGGMDPALWRRPVAPGAAFTRLTYPLFRRAASSARKRGATWERLLDRYFTDDTLKSVLSTPWGMLGAPPWELSSYAMLSMFKDYSRGAWMPVGGYGGLARELARVLADSGGVLLAGHEVTAVDIEEGRVSEVEITPRTKVRTGVAVSDADSSRTFLRLVGRAALPRSFFERMEEREESLSGFAIHLGMAREVEEPAFSGGPVFINPSYDHREMFENVRGGEEFPDPARLAVVAMAHSRHDPALAPGGSSTLELLVPGAPYDFMKRWGVGDGGVRGERYRGIKEKYAEAVVEAVARRFPGLIGNVQAYDISTPVTYERYTMATDGSWYDAAPLAGSVPGGRPGPNTPVRGLYVTGAKSVLRAGIGPSVTSGLLAADAVLRGALSRLF